MGEEPGICPKTISCDHGREEAIAWNIRWEKKKPFPMTIEVKKWSIRWAKKKPFPLTIDVKKS